MEQNSSRASGTRPKENEQPSGYSYLQGFPENVLKLFFCQLANAFVVEREREREGGSIMQQGTGMFWTLGNYFSRFVREISTGFCQQFQ